MPKAPKPIQLSPDALQKQAIQYNTQGYQLADQDAYNRLGQLYPARDLAVSNAAFDLQNQDPNINAALSQSGLATINTKNAYDEAFQLRHPILSDKQRNRTYFADLWGTQGKERAFGLTPHDVAEIATSNTGNQQAFSQALSQIGAQNAQAQAANSAALFGVLGQAGQSAVKVASAYAQPGSPPPYNASGDPYLNSMTYSGGYNPNYAGPNYGQGYASLNLPTNDPDYGNPSYIGLGNSDTSGVAGSPGGF